MTRATVIAAHVVALPAAARLSAAVALTIPSHRAVDVQLHDTYFVVAHFHPTSVLAAFVLVASVVAYRYGSINAPILLSWVLLVIHVCSAVAQGLHRQGSVPAEPDVVMAYFATFVGGACAVVVGLAMSLRTAIRRHR
jgi:hypothetical protein